MQGSAQPPADVPTINSWARPSLVLAATAGLLNTELLARAGLHTHNQDGSRFCYSSFRVISIEFGIINFGIKFLQDKKT